MSNRRVAIIYFNDIIIHMDNFFRNQKIRIYRAYDQIPDMNVLSEEDCKIRFILPFLKEAGIDVENDARYEIGAKSTDYDINAKRMDIVIHPDSMSSAYISTCSMIVEAKSFSTLSNSANDNMRKYYCEIKTYFNNMKAGNRPMIVLTNGNRYEFYWDLNTMNVLDDSPFYAITISDESYVPTAVIDMIECVSSNDMDSARQRARVLLNISKIDKSQYEYYIKLTSILSNDSQERISNKPCDDNTNNISKTFHNSTNDDNTSISRNKRIFLSSLGLHNGDPLSWIHDDNEIYIIIDADKNLIRLKDTDNPPESISRVAARKLNIQSARGIMYFKYNGIPLSEMAGL